jgi:hypothetical protein
MTSSPYGPCYETAANGIRGERTRLSRWPSKPHALCRDAHQWAVERIPLAPTVRRDLRKRRFAQRLPAFSALCLVGCQKSVSCHAAWSYSWIRPPRTSRRRSCPATSSSGSRWPLIAGEPTTRGCAEDDGGCSARHSDGGCEATAGGWRSGDGPGTPGARCRPSARRRHWRSGPGSAYG